MWLGLTRWAEAVRPRTRVGRSRGTGQALAVNHVMGSALLLPTSATTGTGPASSWEQTVRSPTVTAPGRYR